MGYTHLTQEERYQISAGLEIGLSQREVSLGLGRSVSTVSREIGRNGGLAGYRAGRAQQTAVTRASRGRSRPRIQAWQWTVIGNLIRQDWSPEQISQRADMEGTLRVSPERIYLWVYADKAAGGGLYKQLRGRKKYRKRYGSGRERRGRIRDRTCISERPEAVNRRDTIGHWEGDTIVGKRHSGAAVTMVERVTRFTCLSKISNRKAASVRAAISRRFKPHRDRVQTVTFDNGHEFAAHKKIEKDLGAKAYFAEPYSSWQRGTNENTNGLIRQYLPKARDLQTVTGSEVRMIENRLNNRPRKCLGYRTPHELLYNERHELTVALRD